MPIRCPFHAVTGEESCLRSARGWPQVIREEGVGFGKKVIELAPGDEPTTITASCLLESEATVALIVVSAGSKYRAAPIELGGYFVDDVQFTAIRQPALPVHYVK